MKKVIVYHDNESLAHRMRRPRPNETIAYRAVSAWDEEINKNYDEVYDYSTEKPKPKKVLKPKV